MERPKKILITSIGAPKKYRQILWNEKTDPIETPFPFLAVASRWNVDHILLLGTKEALDQNREHYQQLVDELERFGLKNSLSAKEIGALNTREEFWKAFTEVVSNRLFKNEKIDLFIDLTFGYRVQPMLIFLAAYFLRETRQNFHLKKVTYGMEQAEPPHILDMTELIYLLDWLKAAQLFIHGGSAKELVLRIKTITNDQFPKFVHAFEDFTNAYAFNYISYLKKKSERFLTARNKDVKKFLNENYPVYSQVEPLISDFLEIFKNKDQLSLQLNIARRNFDEGAYARSVLILRECYITLFCKVLNQTKNIFRQKVELVLLNRVYFALFDEQKSIKLSAEENRLAEKTFRIMNEAIPEKELQRFYRLWGEIRDIRNAVGHIKNFNKSEEIDFVELKNYLDTILQESKTILLNFVSYLDARPQVKLTLQNLLSEKEEKRLFVIVNEGIHPILPALRQKYGQNIKYEILTAGNVDLDMEKTVAQQCKKIAEKYHDYQIFLVPGGYSYLSITAYSVFQQSMGRHPIWLQYDPGQNRYVEKDLSPRRLLDGGEG
ncbi:hypothetical protein [Caldithrix abyssi]